MTTHWAADASARQRVLDRFSEHLLAMKQAKGLSAMERTLLNTFLGWLAQKPKASTREQAIDLFSTYLAEGEKGGALVSLEKDLIYAFLLWLKPGPAQPQPASGSDGVAGALDCCTATAHSASSVCLFRFGSMAFAVRSFWKAATAGARRCNALSLYFQCTTAVPLFSRGCPPEYRGAATAYVGFW